jgi:hypothetical protein
MKSGETNEKTRQPRMGLNKTDLLLKFLNDEYKYPIIENEIECNEKYMPAGQAGLLYKLIQPLWG